LKYLPVNQGKPNVYFLYEQLISELSDKDLKEFEKRKKRQLIKTAI